MTSLSRTRSNKNWHHQRGAIGLLGVITLLLAVLFTALAVDAGRLWMQRRQLQLVADIASIQAARKIGCDVEMADVLAAAQAAAAANGFTGSLSAAPNVVELGSVETVNGIRQFTADGSSGAVHVYATRTVPASLVAGGLFGGTVTLHAEAVSSADASLGAFSAGTFAVSLNTDDSVLLNAVLGDLLGSSVNLSLASYQGIAATDITLNDLLAASGQVGGVDSLLNTHMTLGQLVDLMATAMSNSGTASAAATTGMQQLATAAVSNLDVTLGDILSVATPDKDAAGKVGLNLLSLITTSALVANGQHAISIPSLTVSAGSIASIAAQINVISPPQMAIGPAANGNGTMCTTLTTAQVEAKVNVTNSLALAKLDLSLKATVAEGSAGLRDITVGDGMTVVTIDASPGLASIKLTNTAGTGNGTIKTLGGITLATLSMNLPVQPASTTELVFNVDHPVADHLPQTQTASSPLGSSLQTALSNAPISVSVANVLNTGLVNGIVSGTVSPLLGQIGKVLLDPLLNMLGIRLGGMDVTLEGLQAHQEKPLII